MMTVKCTSRVLGRSGQYLLGALAVSSGLLGCGGEAKRKGEIVLAVSTDMAIADDLDRVDVIVQRESGKQYTRSIDLYPKASGLFTPGTYAIVAGDKENETVKVSVVARRGGEARLVRELVTTLPKSRVAMVPMPLQWLCEGNASSKGDHSECYQESKDQDETCHLGRCAGSEVDSSELEDMDPKQLYAGFETAEEAAAAGVCFDVVRCFDGSQPAEVDLDACTFPRPAGAKKLNVGMVVSGDGHCNETSGVCYIVLDKSKAYGWDGDETIQLPPGVCDRLRDDDGRVLAVVTSNDCETKTLSVPTCGPWLAAPSSSDRDGDGIKDSKDNCPDDPNPKQEDKDGDGIGDECDFATSLEDRDRDGIADDEDNCPDAPNADQEDTDDDGLGDACDADDDADGFEDEDDPEPKNPYVPDPDRDGIASDEDNCPTIANEDQLDTDEDDIGDACDADKDGDDVKNKLDNCELVSNPDQEDCDSDGEGDACDTCPSTIEITEPRRDSVLGTRLFQISGNVGTLDLSELTVHTESREGTRTFDQTIAVNEGVFESGNLILSAGENEVWAETCNCRSESLRLTADVDPADILVTLTWDQDETDADLYLYEPRTENNVCYFDAPCAEPEGSTALGAILDTDNTEGFGPENYTLSTARGDTLAAGLYRVRVHYFEGTPEIDYQVRVLLNENNDQEQVEVFYGSLSSSNNDQSDPYERGEDWADVAEIVCSGEPVRCTVRAPESEWPQGTGGSTETDGLGGNDSAGGTGGASGGVATGGADVVGTGGGAGNAFGMGGTGGGVSQTGGANTGGAPEATGGVENTGGGGGTTAGGAENTGGVGATGGDVTDNDSDGVANDVDNCPNAGNSDQVDGDLDGVGDACECTEEEDYYDFAGVDGCRPCDQNPLSGTGGVAIPASAVRFGTDTLTQYDAANQVLSFELDPSVGELDLVETTLTLTAYPYQDYGYLMGATVDATRIVENVIYFDLSGVVLEDQYGNPVPLVDVGIGAIVLNLAHRCGTTSEISEVVAEIAPGTGDTLALRLQQCTELATLNSAVSQDYEPVWDGTTEGQGVDHRDLSDDGYMQLAPDVSFTWTVPQQQELYYQFLVNGSSDGFAPTIVLLDSACSLVLGSGSSFVQTGLNAGDEIVIVIGSSEQAGRGPVSLSIIPSSEL